MLRRCASHRCVLPLVMDVTRVPPSDPAVDVLLTDLQWSSFSEAFPDKIHELVKPGEAPLFRILASGIRTTGLLPVRTVVARQRSPYRWVPFLIDTGAHQTFFTRESTSALRLDVADHIEILSDVRVNFRRSSDRFDDINVLGTDFLRSCRIVIDYPRSFVQIDVAPPAASRVFVTDGRMTFPVKPEEATVMYLKQAIKAELSPLLNHIAAVQIVIKHPQTGRIMNDEDELHANMKYSFEAPPKP